MTTLASAARYDHIDLGHLPHVIRTWRQSEGLSLRAAARRLDSSASALRNWESGVAPRPIALVRIVPALGLSRSGSRLAVNGPETQAAPRATDGTPLFRARLAAGLTQSAIATGLHVSTATVSRWESGVRAPEPDLIPPLAALVGLTPVMTRRLFARYPETRNQRVGRLPALGPYLRHRGIGTDEVASITGVSRSIAKAWCSGRTSVPVRSLRALSAVLGVDLLEMEPALRVRRIGTPSPLCSRRRQLGLTQRELATAVGVCQSTISEWERSRRQPRPGHVASVARLLRCSPVDLAHEMRWARTARPGTSDWHRLPMGALLLAERTHHGYKAAEVGRMVGVTPGTVRRWELGLSHPSGRSRRRLALVYGLDGALLGVTSGLPLSRVGGRR